MNPVGRFADKPSPVKHPWWVRVLYSYLQWADHHPVYLAPHNWRWRRYELWDDYCLCSNCERRRADGLQGPYKGKRV